MSRYLFSRKAARAAVAGLPRDQRQFYEQLGAEADVLLEPGYHQDEFFDDQFERRASEKTRTPVASQAVSVISPKTGPWTGNNQLGIQRAFGPDENNRQTILKLDEWGFPELWTLALGLDFAANLWVPSGGPSAAFFDVTAIIEFGVGGVIQTCEIDWVNGTSIVLPMNALNVIAQYNFQTPSEAAEPSEPPLDLRLRASLAKGQLTQTQPVRSYVLVSGTIDIPPFAQKMKVLIQNPNDGEAFDFYSSVNPVLFNSGTIVSGGINVANFMPCQLVEYLSIADNTFGRPVWIDVPTGARSVSFTNAGCALFVQFGIGV